ncbi:MAG: hypothetical protein CK424_02850 [Legionella sp.]|nr:MAG: hypothetical protein CK424_02850 [Legionella sp.]
MTLYCLHTRIIPLLLIVSMLCSCIFPQHYADGVITATQEIPNTYSMKHRVFQDTATFGRASAVAGGVIGGVCFGALGGLISGNPLFAGIASVVGVGAGALSMGLIGITAGAGVGLSRGYINSHAIQYEYTVQSLDKGIFNIKQYSSPIPVNTKVKILRQNDRLFIRKK